MSIFKRGTVNSTVSVSSSVYVCKECGHNEMVKRASKRSKKCPSCGKDMDIVKNDDDTAEKND